MNKEELPDYITPIKKWPSVLCAIIIICGVLTSFVILSTMFIEHYIFN